ncbi:MAG: DUF2948 family protein [Pseudomonadota bacterium]
MAETDDLKLIALDAEDLAVISAQLQDAVLRVGDIRFERPHRRFALIANRFNWMKALKSGDGGAGANGHDYERRQCALRFERVRGVQTQNIDRNDTRRVLSLLAISFESAGSDSPDGLVTLMFSAGAAIRLEVDVIECELRDLGGAWATQARPKHEIAETDADHES